MENNKPIGFQLVGIRTDQFAIVDDDFDVSKPLEIEVNFSVAKTDDQKVLSVMLHSKFLDIDRVIIILECSCHFRITPESWELFRESDTNLHVIPKAFITHLAVITVGTARGILHSKTEGTKFNGHILPTLNLTEIFTTDARVE
jgi:hypothetical protein